jgi:hypothetical protein
MTEQKKVKVKKSEMTESAEKPKKAADGERVNDLPRRLDAGWKMALGRLLPSVLAVFWKPMHEAIDWANGFEDLQTELRAALSEAK